MGEEVTVKTRVQPLVRRVGGWSDETKLMLNSAFNQVEVEVEAEIGKKLSNGPPFGSLLRKKIK